MILQRALANAPRQLAIDCALVRTLLSAARGLSTLAEQPPLQSVREGQPGTHDFRVSYRHGERTISPWHNIALRGRNSENFNFVCEIPRGTRAKMEIFTAESSNPIRQDTKKGALREYGIDSIVNYGALPQTWEDPEHLDPLTGLGGDGDPLDVVEIGSRLAACGEVYPVKVLGVLGMIDEGEMDWKVIAIASSDPLAGQLRDVADVKEAMPGLVEQIHAWFRDYKTYEGKAQATFAFGGEVQGREMALEVIQRMHEQWRDLFVGLSSVQP